MRSLGDWLGINWHRNRGGSVRRTRLAVEALESRDVPTVFTSLQLDEAAQYMLGLINRARANPAAEAARYGIDLNEGLAPGTISAAPKQPLAPNAALMSAIAGHLAVWMQSTAYWSGSVTDPHNGLGDGTVGSRIAAAGYTGANWWGENLAAQWQTNPVADLQAMVDQLEQGLFVDSGVADRGHRLNLLDPNYQEAGVAIASGLVPAGSAAGWNLVLAGQDFAADDSAPALGGGTAGGFVSGVIYQDHNGNGQYDLGEALSGTISVTWTNGSVHGSATASDAGGYTTGKLAPGTWTITISGGPLASPLSTTVTVGTANVEADFNVAGALPAVLPAGFSYDPATRLLTLTAGGMNNYFGLSQAGTMDTLNLDGTPLTVSETLLSGVRVNLAGPGNVVALDTRGESAGQVIHAGNHGARVQHYDAQGNLGDFLVVTGVQSVYATAGAADEGFLDATPGTRNVFVGVGGSAYMDTGWYGENVYSISGAPYVYSYALSGMDSAYQYDGSGASYYVVSGTAYSFMLGTDGGRHFFNDAVGFTVNIGVARHPGQDLAYFYDSAGNDALVAATTSCTMTSADGSFAENDVAYSFAQVYAYSFVGGSDVATVYDASVNHVYGFRRAG